MSYSSAPCLYRDPNSGKKCYQSVGEFRSYCKDHQQPGWKNSFRDKPSEKFVRNRPIVIAKAKGQCEMILSNKERCKENGKEVDHIEALADGGTDDLFNLRYLCEKCHKIKTQEEANRHRNERYKPMPRGRNARNR